MNIRELLVFGFYTFLVAGCCDPDVRPSPTLAYVAHPRVAACGMYTRDIDWRLTQPAPKGGGFIIQEIKFFTDVKDCSGRSIISETAFGYESWEVRENETVSHPSSDGWRVNANLAGPHASIETKGSFRVTAVAQFFPNACLPSDFKVGGIPFGSTPSSPNAPKYWTEAGGVVREVSWDWDCCHGRTSSTPDIDTHRP